MKSEPSMLRICGIRTAGSVIPMPLNGRWW
ncbi:Uncharacterised protein [Mycobacteroides abscessus subsp. massiliense]|nr:Uncharacterised protein [Mycobacteroides abscessus subsp. massiliense]